MQDTIVKQLEAAGITITNANRNRYVKYVLDYWPMVSATNSLHVPALGDEDYYENVYAAAKTGDIELLKMMRDRCYRLSLEQHQEIVRLMKGE